MKIVPAVIFSVFSLAFAITLSDCSTKQQHNFQAARNLVFGSEISIPGKVDPAVVPVTDLAAGTVTFFMIDKSGERRKVIYHGQEPDQFHRVHDLVIIGHLSGTDFIASELMIKCHSRITQLTPGN